MPRDPPPEADVALDYFQRSFPSSTIQEHILIRRWESIAQCFGGSEQANELVLTEPGILKAQMHDCTRAWYQYERFLGPKLARAMVWAQPDLLRKRGDTLNRALPALLNLFAPERVAEILIKSPGLAHVPIGDFYGGMYDMIALAGNPEKATEVSKSAVEKLKGSSHGRRPYVPKGWPALVALAGGYAEAMEMIDKQPRLLKTEGYEMMVCLHRLRDFYGRESAQTIVRKAPHLLLNEENLRANNQKTQEMHGKIEWLTMGIEILGRYFTREEVERRITEQPGLLSLGPSLENALKFATRQLGSPQAVADRFDEVMRRTGLEEHMTNWVVKQRPRWGTYTHSRGRVPLRHDSWSPKNGHGYIVRGRWDEEDDDEQEAEEEQEVEFEEDEFEEIDEEEFAKAWEARGEDGTVKVRQDPTASQSDGPPKDAPKVGGAGEEGTRPVASTA